MLLPSRAFVLLAVGPVLLSIATIVDRSLISTMIVVDIVVILFAGLDALIALKSHVTIERRAPRVMSLGKPNVVTLELRSNAGRRLSVQVNDALFPDSISDGLPASVDLAWLHRTGTATDADLLPASVQDLTFPAGRVHAFVHGEADEIRAIRRHLLADRGLSRADMSCSPYWHRTMADEEWRQVKREYVAAMEADVA